MNKATIGLFFILAGVVYGSLMHDKIYEATLGYLIENRWLTPPSISKINPNVLGRKLSILLYSFTLIIIGLFLLWNRSI